MFVCSVGTKSKHERTGNALERISQREYSAKAKDVRPMGYSLYVRSASQLAVAIFANTTTQSRSRKSRND